MEEIKRLKAEIVRLQRLADKQAVLIGILRESRGVDGVLGVARLVEAGYRVSDACEALGVARSSYYAYLAAKARPATEKKSGEHDVYLLERIRSICSEHPSWGYRRVTECLRQREGIIVNHKRVYRLMRQYIQ